MADRDFYAGIISALAVVKLHNADTIHSEIVALCDLNELLAHAKDEDEIGFAGLGEYEAQHHAHLTPESLVSSQAVVNALALEQSDGDSSPAQAQVA